jgi:hypothetical protein
MKREVERRVPRRDRVAAAVVVVVGLSVAMMFGLLYTLTPPTVATVEHQYTMNQQ